MAEFLSVDRIAGDVALCEDKDRTLREIPLAELPHGVKEGDVLRLEAGGYALDPEEQERRRLHNRALFERLMAQKKIPPEEQGEQE